LHAIISISAAPVARICASAGRERLGSRFLKAPGQAAALQRAAAGHEEHVLKDTTSPSLCG